MLVDDVEPVEHQPTISGPNTKTGDSWYFLARRDVEDDLAMISDKDVWQIDQTSARIISERSYGTLNPGVIVNIGGGDLYGKRAGGRFD